MKTNVPTDTPREDWTLDQLGQFAQQIAKRTAHNAWLIGRAYTLAKAKAKAEGKKIERWHKEWLPFVSQPTLSRYEAISKLPEEEVTGKGLTEVYRLIGIVPTKASPDKAHAPRNATPAGESPKTNSAETDASTSPPPAGESPQKSTAAEAADAPTEPAPKPEPQQATAFKVLPAEPAGEPDSLLKRLAPVVALLHSIVHDMPSLDTTLDATPAINDAMALLQQIRTWLEKTAAA